MKNIILSISKILIDFIDPSQLLLINHKNKYVNFSVKCDLSTVDVCELMILLKSEEQNKYKINLLIPKNITSGKKITKNTDTICVYIEIS